MKRLCKPLDVLKVDESLKFTKLRGFISPLLNRITSLIIIQNCYSCNNLQSALQYEGTQYGYSTITTEGLEGPGSKSLQSKMERQGVLTVG